LLQNVLVGKNSQILHSAIHYEPNPSN
jgi:hypothetical protein